MPPLKWYRNKNKIWNWEFKGINDPREFQDFDFEGTSKEIFGGVNMKTGIFKEANYNFPQDDLIGE